MGVVECITIGKGIAAQERTYEIDSNQELIAIGASKIIGGLFSAMPSSGSFSRSAINAAAGARSQVSTLVAALLVLLTLLFLTPLFYYLPKAILATIIILSVFKLIAIGEARALWSSHRGDFWMLTITFASTLMLGIVTGVFLGVVLSLAMVLYRISKPHLAVLGRVPGKPYYRNIERFDSVIEVDDHLIVRFDQQLYFGNADFFKDRIRQLIKQHTAPLHAVFLDAQGINAIDSSGMRSLLDLNRDLTERGIHFYICNPIGPIRDRINSHNEKYPNEALTLSMFLHDAVMQEMNGG
jgi:sulfate permease, SulP family